MYYSISTDFSSSGLINDPELIIDGFEFIISSPEFQNDWSVHISIERKE